VCPFRLECGLLGSVYPLNKGRVDHSGHSWAANTTNTRSKEAALRFGSRTRSAALDGPRKSTRIGVLPLGLQAAGWSTGLPSLSTLPRTSLTGRLRKHQLSHSGPPAIPRRGILLMGANNPVVDCRLCLILDLSTCHYGSPLELRGLLPFASIDMSCADHLCLTCDHQQHCVFKP
jgi:hypothetical protein